MKKEIIIGALLLTLGFVIGILCRPHRIERVVDIQRDTTFIRDTHIIEKPVLVEQTSKETLLVEVHDTTRIHDTLYIALPMEKKIYKGEDYLAEISGYKPSLDRIEVYPKNTIITETITQSVTNRNTLGVGIEVDYMTALSFPIYLEYGRMLHENVEIYGRVMRDMRMDMTGVAIGARFQFGW